MKGFAGRRYWFPYPLISPQSGHCQVMPLQVRPHWFSYMQDWHMANPHLQVQQNMNSPLQQWHSFFAVRSLLRFLLAFTDSPII